MIMENLYKLQLKKGKTSWK